jgi:hypothetical protein
MIFERLFCQEMQELKQLVASLKQSTSGGNDLPVQYPDSPADMTIEADQQITIPSTVNRILKFVSCDVPDGVIIEIWRDNQRLCWFTDESGSMPFDGGVWIGELTIIVKNTTAYALRWSVRMVFSA